MPKLPSATDTAPSASTNNKGKGKALQPVSVATRVLPPRKRVSALASSSNINSTISARATSASSSSPPPAPSSSSSSSSPDGTASNVRRISDRKSHHHPSYIAYSPRTDPTLYLDQLETPMSDVREKKRRARPVSSFSELNVAAPVPSKRLRHHPRSRVHHAQQKYKERQQAAAAAAAAAKAAASAVAQQQQQQQQHHHHQASSSRSSSSLHRRGPEYAYPRESLQVQLTQDLPVIDDNQLNEKAKEKEYWRRQRRVFVRSRFITNEEATAIANSVYKSTPVGPQDRIVVTFQANIANFRSKWRKLLKELVKKFSVSKNLVTAQDSEPFEKEVRSKVDIAMLQRIWGHWLSDPFVDEEAFYANHQNVDTLTAVTVQAICVTLRYHYGLMKERDFRKQLDDLDKYTRNLHLPDPFSSLH